MFLSTNNLTKKFGDFAAVDGVSIEIKQGSIIGLIGPNGAGKTTLFNTIAGLYPPSSGKVFLGEKEITGFSPHKLFAMGVLRTFQQAHEFSSMTVRENLMVVPGHQLGEEFYNSWFQRAKISEQERAIREKVSEVIEFLEMEAVADELAGNLSAGQKKLLELGRTIMIDPIIIFLDEVGAGVNKTLLSKITQAIIRLNKKKKYTFCLIEHDMKFVGDLCDHVICMAEGKVLAEGSIREITENEKVISAYLGSRTKND